MKTAVTQFYQYFLQQPQQYMASAVAVFWAIFQLIASLYPAFDTITLRCWHIIFFALLIFFLSPAYSRAKCYRFIFDVFCVVLAVGAFGYLFITYDIITLRGGWLLPIDYIVAAAGTLAAFLLAFRMVPSLAVLALIFFAYIIFGDSLPGMFGHAGFSWRRIVDHMFWGTQGLLGIGIGVSASYIFIFILLGAFLQRSGFSSFINDLASSFAGRSCGGPAKMAVVASALMGMMNGSAVANVAVTGSMTIPLMKRSGYRPEFAAAVEAVASTGGQFTPPVMGAVAFVMAEFLAVPYTKVMLAAIIPAFLYYLSLFIAVHLEARRYNLEGLSLKNIPKAGKVLKERGYLLLSPVVLLGMMLAGFTPLFAACLAIFAAIVSSWFSPVKSERMGFVAIIQAMDAGARMAVSLGVACLILGVIIGTMSLTGLGLTLTSEILRGVPYGHIYTGGFLVMCISVVLGMGVPGVAAYVITASLGAPILITIGVEPLAAHMFCLIYACLGNITPPVALSSYVAAGIAQSSQTMTSLLAVKLGLAGFILPFFFLDSSIFWPGFSFSLHVLIYEILPAWRNIAFATLGVISLTIGLQGWLWGPCSTIVRGLFLLVALLAMRAVFIAEYVESAWMHLFVFNGIDIGIVLLFIAKILSANIALLLFGGIVIYQWKKYGKKLKHRMTYVK